MMNIVDLNKVSLMDIPGQLRKLADAIENGEHSNVDSLTVVLQNEFNVDVFGYGHADLLKSIALFNLAITKLTTSYFGIAHDSVDDDL